MTESLQDIERLVDSYGTARGFWSGATQRDALLSAITRVVQERDEKLAIQAVILATQTTIITDYRKRIAVLEKALGRSAVALNDIIGKAVVQLKFVDHKETSVWYEVYQIANNAIDAPQDAALSTAERKLGEYPRCRYCGGRLDQPGFPDCPFPKEHNRTPLPAPPQTEGKHA